MDLSPIAHLLKRKESPNISTLEGMLSWIVKQLAKFTPTEAAFYRQVRTCLLNGNKEPFNVLISKERQEEIKDIAARSLSATQAERETPINNYEQENEPEDFDNRSRWPNTEHTADKSTENWYNNGIQE